MKIAMVHLNLTTESGDPRMFFSICQSLRTLGHEVHIYTAEHNPMCFPDLSRNFPIHVVAPPAPLDTGFDARGLIGRVKAKLYRGRLLSNAARRIGDVLPPDLDVLVCQNDASYELGVGYKKKNHRARIVWIMNNAPFYSGPKGNVIVKLLSAFSALWERHKVAHYLRGIDVVFVHDIERKKMIDALGVSSIVLRIPVDFESFYVPVKKRLSKDKKVTLLGVGSLSPMRRFEDIILAATFLRKKGYDARVELVCKDFWKDTKYRSELISLIRDLYMDPYVQFHFEGVSESVLRDIQRNSDVFIFPNHVNIWGMAALEAMAAGLPLVVSRVTSVAEVLNDGESALMCEPENPDDIALKVRALIDNPALYEKIGEMGQHFVKENLTWEKYSKDFIGAIENK